MRDRVDQAPFTVSYEFPVAQKIGVVLHGNRIASGLPSRACGCRFLFANQAAKEPSSSCEAVEGSGRAWLHATDRQATAVAATSIEAPVWLLSNFRHAIGKVVLQASNSRHWCGAHFPATDCGAATVGMADCGRATKHAFGTKVSSEKRHRTARRQRHATGHTGSSRTTCQENMTWRYHVLDSLAG
jgi:hypothetical protein